MCCFKMLKILWISLGSSKAKKTTNDIRICHINQQNFYSLMYHNSKSLFALFSVITSQSIIFSRCFTKKETILHFLRLFFSLFCSVLRGETYHAMQSCCFVYQTIYAERKMVLSNKLHYLAWRNPSLAFTARSIF